MNALYQSSECRLSVNSGKHSIVINARHDFAGHSMWNPAHGVMKAVQMGTWDHISVCGHKHVHRLHAAEVAERPHLPCHAGQQLQGL
ncbi:hypothetical protein [Pseudomonas aeruginosa]|uniref:hypothetical protein n=1 Tax=Pseudomonas aeruginosa TaxID=287 RepID=UPI0011B270A0|nr:hypothetical protein [Pseudomonas aeruginosa]